MAGEHSGETGEEPLLPWVFHVDMDQFMAAVEIRRRPDLVGLPVVVGGRGDPTERGVVSTASYEAREFGVRSGMALRIAARRCPDAVFLPVDMPVYAAASAAVMDTLRAYPGAVVEVIGIDEAFVAVTCADPEGTAQALRAEVLARTALQCSIGIGQTLVQAKTATGFGKPQGVYEITRDTWLPLMGPRPVTDLWGIGTKTGRRLGEIGIETVEQLATAHVEALIAAFGPSSGRYISQLGRGEGRSSVDDTPWIPRAHGHETTYQQDLTQPEQVHTALHALAVAVMEDLRHEGRPCMRVFLKVRFAPFFTFQRSRKLAEPTTDPAVVAATAADLLAALDDPRPIRLLGIRGEMVPPPGGY